VAHSLEAQGLARVTPDKDLMERPEDFIPKIMDSYHHMGGTRMALSPSQGVVDDQLKIHGTKNAYVCSSSVFPSSGFSNPTHTLLALSVRLADHLNRFQ
jgi:choline dehydrogenase-like flavoprotein